MWLRICADGRKSCASQCAASLVSPRTRPQCSYADILVIERFSETTIWENGPRPWSFEFQKGILSLRKTMILEFETFSLKVLTLKL